MSMEVTWFARDPLDSSTDQLQSLEGGGMVQATTAGVPQLDFPPLSSPSINCSDMTQVQGAVQLQSETSMV